MPSVSDFCCPLSSSSQERLFLAFQDSAGTFRLPPDEEANSTWGVERGDVLRGQPRRLAPGCQRLCSQTWSSKSSRTVSETKQICLNHPGTAAFQWFCFVWLFVAQKCWITLPLNGAPQTLHPNWCNSKENELGPQKPGGMTISP